MQERGEMKYGWLWARVPDSFKEEVDDYCKREDRSVSSTVRVAVSRLMEEDGQKTSA